MTKRFVIQNTQNISLSFKFLTERLAKLILHDIYANIMFGKYTIKYLESSQLSLNKDANKYFNELKFTVL